MNKVGIKTLTSNAIRLFQFVFVYAFIVTMIYIFIILIPENIFGYTTGLALFVYITLSATSIILTTWGEKIGRFFRKLVTKNYVESNIEYTLNQKKIRFILILIYFIAIIIFTICSLSDIHLFDTEQMDYSIIQSFATYISYDRMVRNYPTINRANDEDSAAL